MPNDRPLDIIDAYPGVGIWSSKFHEFIKPRRHILLEPNTRVYGQFLNPLVEQSGSRYVNLPWDPSHGQTFSDLFDKGYLPEQTQRNLGPRNICEVNDTLLVLANMALAWGPSKLRYSELHDYIDAMLEQTLFHRYGLVRIIAMFPTSHLESAMPKSISRRRRIQTLMEGVAVEATEVAGDTSETNYWTRKGMHALKEGVNQTSNRAKDAQVTTPPGRSAKKLEFAPKPIDIGGKLREYAPRPKHEWHDEYTRAYKDMAKEARNGIAKSTSHKSPVTKRFRTLQSPATKRFKALQKRFLYESSQIESCYEADNKQAEIDKLENKLREIMIKNLPPPDYFEAQGIIHSFKRLRTERDRIIESLGKQYSEYHYPIYRDERRASSHTEPLLFWDRRPYEPLHAYPDEFFPKVPGSMVDIRPNPDSPIFMLQNHYKQTNRQFVYRSVLAIFRALLRTFNAYQKKPVSQVLSLLFPDRSMSEFPVAIPSLVPYTTPSISLYPNDAMEWTGVKHKGNVTMGYNDDCLQDATLHIIPTAVIWDMAVEWERWPMRTSVANLSKSLGGALVNDLDATFEAKG